MELQEVLRELEKYGTAQNRKIYIRHGAKADKVYGLSFKNLNHLAKKIKRNQSLAEQLWETDNYDARNLATKIVDPKLITLETAKNWIAGLNNSLHGPLLSAVIAQTEMAKELLKFCLSSTEEYVKQTGFSIISSILKQNAAYLSDKEVLSYLKRIEKEIHASPNWARYSMNWALISIGTYKDTLRAKAIETAKTIGKVEVDHHRETSCKTPQAEEYIKKAYAHRKKKSKF